MMVGRYAAGMLLITAAAAGAAWRYQERLGEDGFRGVLAGLGLAALGTVSAMALVAWSFDKGQRQFFAALVGGILARLVMFGSALTYVALRTSMDLTATVAALLSFYVVGQVLEIRMVLVGLADGKGRGDSR
jgi:hypothetical protein